MFIKGQDEIPDGLYILRIHGENWPTADPYERKVKVFTDSEGKQFIQYERSYYDDMDQIRDRSTFEPTEFDEAILE